MPVFQNPLRTGQKRISDSEEPYAQGSKKLCLREATAQQDQMVSGEQYWVVQWRAPQYKKHKTWDGDGVLVLSGPKGALYDLEGKLLTSGKSPQTPAVEGAFLHFGNKELEVDCAISRSDYLSGACFGRVSIDAPDGKPKHASTMTLAKKFMPLKPLTMNLSRPQTSERALTEVVEKKKGVDLVPVNLIQTHVGSEHIAGNVKDTHWAANWRRPQQKKHKTWDGDAYVTHSGKKLTLISEDGKLMGTSTWNCIPLYSGYQAKVGGKDVELDRQVLVSQMPRITGTGPSDSSNYDDDDIDDDQSLLGTGPSTSFLLKSHLTNAALELTPSELGSSVPPTKKFVAPTNFYGKTTEQPKGKGPLHDPNADDAVVMKAPTKEHEKRHNVKNRPVVPVVIDPVLARHLRPHQKEGVKFLYECVMGLRKHEGQGCILADEMGMGKTLQTITLIWTLLKQNPYAGSPVVGKALIVCPATLIHNWKKEFHKWLGRDRIGVFVGDKDNAVVKQFINSKIHHVLIIGYEKLRNIISELAYCMPPIGLIICDEGHRLKSANNKTSAMFDALRTPRRIILSGTPIQNALGEFHAMADFCNPGLLDDYSTFRRLFETPILKSRAPDCSKKEAEIGEARAAQLLAISKNFVLRREANILSNYLPPKYQYVVFVTPTSLQKAMFEKILRPDTLQSILRGSTAHSLALINKLTKLSNSPILLKASMERKKDTGNQDDSEQINKSTFEEALKLLPERAQPEDVTLSGKLIVLADILRAIRKNTEEKCIIVSHYTSTLNIIEAFCKKKGYTYLRLDGQTPVSKRQEYVDSFNKSSQVQRFLFLLSAKAGGIGLNLVGASRLCLIDSDWNPSHDLQSMARIHRDGQKRPVFIYRLLTAGAIDEKIYQRQVTKLGLSDSLMGTGAADGGGKSKSDSFSHKELRDLFTIHHHTACQTHDLLGCICTSNTGHTQTDETDIEEGEESSDDCDDHQSGFMIASNMKPGKTSKLDKAYAKKKKAELAVLGEWTHINCLSGVVQENIHDDILRAIVNTRLEEQTPLERKSRVEALLDAVDLENLATPQLTANDVPGGTISFLFERGSKSEL